MSERGCGGAEGDDACVAEYEYHAMGAHVFRTLGERKIGSWRKADGGGVCGFTGGDAEGAGVEEGGGKGEERGRDLRGG